jgi:hypothetical protein
MNPRSAKKIGGKCGLISVAWGLCIAQITMTFIASGYSTGIVKAFLWFTDVDWYNNKVTIFISTTTVFLVGFFYGQIAGEAIIIKQRKFTYVGLLVGLAVLCTTSVVLSVTAFFEQNLHDSRFNRPPPTLKPPYFQNWLKKMRERKERNFNLHHASKGSELSSLVFKLPSKPLQELLENYIAIVLWWSIIFGGIPAGTVGVWFGWKVKQIAEQS